LQRQKEGHAESPLCRSHDAIVVGDAFFIDQAISRDKFIRPALRRPIDRAATFRAPDTSVKLRFRDSGSVFAAVRVEA
jgi:hypothetical protein